MTEPDVASSDARNLQTKLTKIVDNDGSVKYLLNGKKWWSTGAMDPRCKVALVVAQMDYSHSKCLEENVPKRDNQTVVVVPMPHPGVKCVRPLTVFGYDDAPHGHAEVWLENIELDESAIVLGEGKGFEISQSRLGPGRIHHCEYLKREPACFHVAFYFVPLTELSTAFFNCRYASGWIRYDLFLLSLRQNQRNNVFS
jgi:acyl-CoA dehydrogenase